MKSKKVVSFLVVLVMALALFTACAQTPAPEEAASAEPAAAEAPAAEAPAAEAEPAEPAAEPEPEADAAGEVKGRVGVSEMSAHPFFAGITVAIRSVLEPAGYEVIAKASDYEVTQQIADTEDFVVQKVDGILFSPFDPTAARPAIEAAHDAGIPLICYDNPSLDVDLIVANVATDNYEAGVQNAEQCIKDLGGEGKVVILDIAGGNAANTRVEGFKETLAEKAPDIEIVSEQDYGSMQDEAMNIVENALQANPDLKAVFAANETGAYGAIAAIEAAQKTDAGICIYSVDGSKDAIELIKEGKMTGTAAQQTIVVGETSANMLLDVFAGKTVDKEVLVAPLYITIENADSFEGF